jgi:hypothetical protein
MEKDLRGEYLERREMKWQGDRESLCLVVEGK